MKVVKPIYVDSVVNRASVFRHILSILFFSWISYLNFYALLYTFPIIIFSGSMLVWRFINPVTLGLYKEYIIINGTTFQSKGLAVEKVEDVIILRGDDGSQGTINPYAFKQPHVIQKYFFKRSFKKKNWKHIPSLF